MKLFSDCSGPCEECRYHYTMSPGGCLAGHGDDHFCYISPEEIEKFTNDKKSTDDKAACR